MGLMSCTLVNSSLMKSCKIEQKKAVMRLANELNSRMQLNSRQLASSLLRDSSVKEQK